MAGNTAVEWIKQVIKENMIKVGQAGWMADFGEYLPTDALLHSGESAELYHNRYPAEWARVNHEAIAEAGREADITFFSRAGYSGSSKQAYVVSGSSILISAATPLWPGLNEARSFSCVGPNYQPSAP